MKPRPRPYKPHAATKAILDRAMEHIKSVPYKVSSRWLFYRLNQDGIYSGKEDYRGLWTPLCARVRHKFYGEWDPETLADDTRGRIQRVGFFMDRAHLKERIIPFIANNIEIDFDHFYYQEKFVIVAFEAKAMIQQFEYYTKGIDLLPFGGDASIPFKWEIAKHLENCWTWYGKPIHVLYFGDSDDKGKKIFEAAMRHIQEWCACPFEAHWCGLTEEQALDFGLPENPDKPGEYQWEALDDAQARQLINGALARFNISSGVIETLETLGESITEEWREKVEEALTPLLEGWKV